MVKCRYCGKITDERICPRCYALIEETKPVKEQKTEQPQVETTTEPEYLSRKHRKTEDE